jgi:IS30 family transposase
MDYQYLTTFERGRIEAFHNSGYTVRVIGKQINRHHSTIARELSRNNNTNQLFLHELSHLT